MDFRPYGVYTLYDMRRWWPFLFWPFWQLVTSRPIPDYTVYGIGAVLITYSFIKWRCARYRVSACTHSCFHGIGVRQGLLFRKALHISAEDAASVEIERTPLLWLCGGRRVRVNTAGLRRRADAVLYLPARQVQDLFVLSGWGDKRYRVKVWPVIVMALTGSNAVVGLLTAVPLLRWVGRLYGERLTPDAQTLLSADLPLLFRTAANFLLLGWGIAVVKLFLRYRGFYANAHVTHLHLVSGLFTRRDVLIDRNKITGIELRQTLWMRLCGLYTAIVMAAGYGRDMGARPILIPAGNARTVSDELYRLLPSFPVKRARLKPMAHTWWRYVWLGLIGLVMGGALWCQGSVLRVPAVFVVGASLWWSAVRWLGYRDAGFGADHAAVTIWYPKGLALYRVYLPRETVDHVRVTQSPWQRRSGSCTVSVWCFGEKKRRHRVRGLPYDAVCYELGKMA